MASDKTVLTHPLLEDTPMDTDQAISVMSREIAGESNGGWKYKDKALQEAHDLEVAKAANLRNLPPVQPQPKTDAVNLSGIKGETQAAEENTDNTKGGIPSTKA